MKPSEYKGFVMGVGFTLALIKKQHDPSGLIDAYREAGIPLSDYEKYCDEFDIKEIRILANESKR